MTVKELMERLANLVMVDPNFLDAVVCIPNIDAALPVPVDSMWVADDHIDLYSYYEGD